MRHGSSRRRQLPSRVDRRVDRHRRQWEPRRAQCHPSAVAPQLARCALQRVVHSEHKGVSLTTRMLVYSRDVATSVTAFSTSDVKSRAPCTGHPPKRSYHRFGTAAHCQCRRYTALHGVARRCTALYGDVRGQPAEVNTLTLAKLKTQSAKTAVNSHESTNTRSQVCCLATTARTDFPRATQRSLQTHSVRLGKTTRSKGLCVAQTRCITDAPCQEEELTSLVRGEPCAVAREGHIMASGACGQTSAATHPSGGKRRCALGKSNPCNRCFELICRPIITGVVSDSGVFIAACAERTLQLAMLHPETRAHDRCILRCD